MKGEEIAFAIAVVLMISSCTKPSEAASIPQDDEQIMRRLALYTAREPVISAENPDVQVEQKRYSQSTYTSERGRGNDRAAVRRLLNMLVGKRSDMMAQQKRSGGIAALDGDIASAFDDVHGYVLLVGKITNDVMQDVTGNSEEEVDYPARE